MTRIHNRPLSALAALRALLGVAAFFTPHASFARCSDSPDLAHSCLTHCFTGIGPSGPVTVQVR